MSFMAAYVKTGNTHSEEDRSLVLPWERRTSQKNFQKNNFRYRLELSHHVKLFGFEAVLKKG